MNNRIRGLKVVANTFAYKSHYKETRITEKYRNIIEKYRKKIEILNKELNIK